MSRKILRPPLPYIGAMLSLTLGHCLTLVAAIAYFSGRLYCGSLKLKQCLFSWPDFILLDVVCTCSVLFICSSLEFCWSLALDMAFDF